MKIGRVPTTRAGANPIGSSLSTLLRKHGDVLLAAAVVMAIGIIVIPMPPILLDLALACNLTLAVTLLMISLYVPEALSLASFPSILLITTL